MSFNLIGNFTNGQLLGSTIFFPTIADFNEDGLLEPLGFINSGDGTFNAAPTTATLSLLEPYAGRVNRDNRVFDIDGDGYLDVFWNVYSSPEAEQSFSLILYGNGTGGFTHLEERRDVNGFGETLVVADFDNDGDSDIYSPVYTHVFGNDSGYLLFNNNGVFGRNQALEWDVALSNLPAIYRVEGAQAADVNFDGRIDMYVGSNLFLNNGIGFEAQPLSRLTFEEGANLFDFDNDGDFDLVLRPVNFGPQLFENVDGVLVDKGIITGDYFFGLFGLNVADLDSNGWVDIIFGTENGITVLFNNNGQFTRHDLDVEGGDKPFDTMAVGDIDGDGRLDIVGRSPVNGGELYFFKNELVPGDNIILSVFGANGELNQHGRSVAVSPRDLSGLTLARVVDSGSGYLSQGQYDLYIGLPNDVAYDVSVFYADGPLSFIASASQKIQTYLGVGVSVSGTDINDIMGGSFLSDNLIGAGGDDLFFGSTGADSIDGGDGVDTVDWSNFSEGIVADLSIGKITVGNNTQSIRNVENLIGTGFADILVGGTEINRLSGGEGNDFLADSGDGDILVGGAGDDTYLISSTSTIVIEQIVDGIDTVNTSLSTFLLPIFIENLVGTSSTGQQLIGNSLDNSLSGSSGADLFRGGLGNDTYYVGEGDQVEELFDQGIDEVITAMSIYFLPDFVENITGTSNGEQALYGNALDNTFNGEIGSYTFLGGDGDDFFNIDATDTVIELPNGGTDTIRTAQASYVLVDNVERLIGVGSARQDLTGNSSNNFFSADANFATFSGLAGDDIYVVKSSQVVIEIANNGVDEVQTALAVYRLPAEVENLTGIGLSGQKLIGNELNNILTGSVGVDTLFGRGGNDTYIIQNTFDSAVESLGDGFDIIRSSVSYVIFDNSEIERLEALDLNGTEALNLTGNAFAQTIQGNAGNNILTGGGGGDTLIGLGGDDIYVISDASDIVVEAANGGYDGVASFISYALAAGAHVEHLYARDIRSTVGITLTGNELAQLIDGNAGNNILIGGGGGDTLRGLGGDDEYQVTSNADRVIEFANDGFDTIRTTASYNLTAGMFIERLEALDLNGTGALNLTGNAFAQTIQGNAGNNILTGGGGGDTLIGLGGDDEYQVTSNADRVIEFANDGFDTIRTTASYNLTAGMFIERLEAFDLNGTEALNLTGNAFAQTIQGNAGNNILTGGGGGDTLIGLGGDDEYQVTSNADRVIEFANDGFDTIRTTASYNLTAGMFIERLEALDLNGTGALNLTGNAFAQTIQGNAGNNILTGGGGGDTLIGLGGDDEYQVTSNADRVIEFANDGFDTIRTTASYNLTAGMFIERLEAFDLNGTGALNLTGNAFAQTIQGNAGNNILTGGGGGDTLIGLGGDDIYVISDASDIVVEAANGGYDRVASFISYALAAGAHVEHLYARDIRSAVGITLTGNELAQLIDGNAGNNILIGGGGGDTLRGLGGDDEYQVTSNADRVIEFANDGFDTIRTTASYNLTAGMFIERLEAFDLNGTGALNLTGNAFAQTIQGNAGNNILTGGGGGDTLIGLGGDDIYVISDASDIVVEAANGGYDRVASFISYALAAGAHVEHLYARDIRSAVGITLTGNELAQLIDGNAGNNILIGGGGGDTLRGLGGDDEYQVTSNADRVIEFANDGFDTIRTTASYNLTAGMFIERLEAFDLNGTGALNLTGNAFAQTIQGNAGNNILTGGGGGDTLIGLGGDDIYVISDASDIVVEAANGGYDRVASFISYALAAGAHVEHLYARDIRSAVGITLTGNELAQLIDGNAGNNILIGGGGGDTLRGLGGDDEYQVTSNADRVIEFANDGFDTIRTTASYNLTAGMFIERLEAFDLNGTGALNLTGNAFAQTIQGNAGNNILTGGGGGDTLIGLGGDDLFQVNGFDFAAIIGGADFDTIAISGANHHLDLTFPIVQVETIEAIDLSGSGDNHLTITASAVQRVSGSVTNGVSQLVVAGNDGDSLQATGFIANGTTVLGQITYKVYESGGSRVLVSQSVTVNTSNSTLITEIANTDGQLETTDIVTSYFANIAEESSSYIELRNSVSDIENLRKSNELVDMKFSHSQEQIYIANSDNLWQIPEFSAVPFI